MDEDKLIIVSIVFLVFGIIANWFAILVFINKRIFIDIGMVITAELLIGGITATVLLNIRRYLFNHDWKITETIAIGTVIMYILGLALLVFAGSI